MPMSPWCAAAVETNTARAAEAGSPPAFAAGVAPRSCHHAKPPRISTATISQIHQRLLWVDAFSVVCCPGFLESAEFACCSVTCTPQIDEGQSSLGNRSCAPSMVWMRRTFRGKNRLQEQSSPDTSGTSYHRRHCHFDVREGRRVTSYCEREVRRKGPGASLRSSQDCGTPGAVYARAVSGNNCCEWNKNSCLTC